MSWKTVTTVKQTYLVKLNKRNNFQVSLESLGVKISPYDTRNIHIMPFLSKITLGKFAMGYNLHPSIKYETTLREHFVRVSVYTRDIRDTPAVSTSYWFQHDTGQTSYRSLNLYRDTVYAIISQWFDSNNTGGGNTVNQTSSVYIDGQLISYARDFEDVSISGLGAINLSNVKMTSYIKRVNSQQTVTVSGTVGSGRANQGIRIHQYQLQQVQDLEAEISCLIIVGG